MKRGNGRGSLYYEKARDRWCVAITLADGTRKVKRFRTKSEAENCLDDINSSIHRGTFVEPINITLGEWLILFLTTYKKDKVKSSTYYNYLALMKIAAPLANIRMQQESGINVQRFFNECGYAVPTQRALFQFLNMAVKKAVALGVTPKNFMSTVELKRTAKRKVEVFTMDELDRIEKELKNTVAYPIFVVAKYTGMRPGEIYALTWNDIDLIGMTISVTHNVYRAIEQDTPKTSHSIRTIPIGEKLTAYLRKYKLEHPGRNHLFITRNNTFIYGSSVRSAWKRALERAGVRYRKFYCMRHTHASMLIANGMPIPEVSARLGHASSAVTMAVYAHYIPSDKQKTDIDSYIK